MSERFIPKVLVTKIGFDGHDRGSRVVAAALRDAGMEVIYTPPWQEIPAVVKLATEEDVDVIGISSHASNYAQIEELVDLARANELDDTLIVVGGNIPREAAQQLLAKGVHKLFLPGSSSAAIVEYLSTEARTAKARAKAAPPGLHGGAPA